MSSVSTITRYTPQNLTKLQQEELEGFKAFVILFNNFGRTATEEMFTKIFGSTGAHLWGCFVGKVRKDITLLVFEKYMTPNQVTQLFFYLIQGTVFNGSKSEIPNDLEVRLRGNYGFIFEIRMFGNCATRSTFDFLFEHEGEKKWLVFCTTCKRDACTFVFGDYLTPEHQAIVFCNVLLHTTEYRFKNFDTSTVNLLRSFR